MKKQLILMLTCISTHCFLWGDQQNTPPPLATIDQQLKQAHKDFSIAEKMFNPWYGGPLLTPGAQNCPPDKYVIQPIIIAKNTFGSYNKNRHAVKAENDTLTINPSLGFAMGWLSWLDFSASIQALYQETNGASSTNFGDSQVAWGFQILHEKPYIPSVRFTLGETLPTGKYNNLDITKLGTDAAGAGAFTTNMAFNVSKVFWWISTHPFAWRMSLNYAFANAPVHLDGLSAYGGASNTHGKVRPGNTIVVDTAIEYSFTKYWVLALDAVYSHQTRSSFSGNPGLLSSGLPAFEQAPSSESLSFAPAIEYNPSDHFGFSAGAWFSAYGRNSSQFVSGVVTGFYVW